MNRIAVHRKILAAVLTIMMTSLWSDKFPADASKLTISVKVHKVGGGIISNLGYMEKPVGIEIDNLGKPALGKATAEIGFSTGGRNAVYLGGIVNHRKVFSCGEEWSDKSNYWGYEFFPSGEPWDSIWVVYRDEEADIPYLPNFKGVSDEDFVCRYDDYHVDVRDQTIPLGVEVIQISHAWGVEPYSQWKYFQFYIIAKNDIQQLYFGWSSFGSLGRQHSNPSDFVNPGNDDISYFDESVYMAFKEDQVGHDADGIGPAGFKFWPPEGYSPEELKWSLNNRIMPNHYDDQMYDLMASGVQDKPNPGSTFMLLSYGPFDMSEGDTLHFQVADIPGRSREEILANLAQLENLIDRNFALPTSPPAPPLRVTSGNHQALLEWDAQPGTNDPYNWIDLNRADYEVEPRPFEGFRLYKSFHENGPWTLLAQYDIAGNGIYQDTGLEFSYTDVGLLNNVRYYYSIVAFSKPDQVTGFHSLSSAINLSRVQVIPGTQVPQSVGEVFVVPNPYRGDQNYSQYKPPWEEPSPLQNILQQEGNEMIYRWTETDRRIQFVNVPSPSRIIIYSLCGDRVQTMQHNNPNEGVVDWNLTSYKGLTVASGIYMYTVEDLQNRQIQAGKFVIIK